MDGGGSAGNPSAASSRSLPALTNEETLQPADWISASEEDDGQSRESVSLSGSQKHQSPAKTQRTAEEPDQLGLTKHTNHTDPPTEKQKPEDSPTKPAQLKPKRRKERKLGNSPLTEKQKTGYSSQTDHPKPGQLSSTKPDTDPKRPEDPFCTKHEQKPDPPPHPPLKDLTVFTSKLDEQSQKELELLISESKDQQNHQDPPPEKLTLTIPERYQDHQDSPAHIQHTPPPAHLDTQQVPPPAHLGTQQAPPSAHLNNQQVPPPPPAHLDTQQAPPPHLDTQQAPPPPPAHLDTQQAPPPHLDTQQAPSSAHLDTQQAPPSACLDTQQAPPPPSAHLDTQQAPPPPYLDTQQAPPPHLDTQQAPPPHLNTQAPPAEEQNLSSPQALPSIIHPTEASAPPLTIEVLCEKSWPRPPVASSGEPKLCGFLQKQGGPLRAWKLRWFTYEEKKNQLFYYRTPQDVTPLGRVELCSATFTYPLKAEPGTFHIKTPERTFILKAVTQELMLYWLQQLQVKRWQHRQMSDPTNNNNTADGFLPVLKSPLGLVGEEAANVPSQRMPLANMSIKHPLIEIQNSVHSLRKRSSQEWSQSVFHVEAPPWTPPTPAGTTNTTVPPAHRTPIEPPTPPPPLSLAEPAGQASPAEGRESPSLFDSWSRKTKNRGSSTTQVPHRDTLSSDRTSRLQQEKQMLMEEVKAQKELVWILHKALEASQLEKRTCAEFLAETGEQERLELLRHRERQAADLRGRLEEAKTEAEASRRIVAQRDAQLAELQENILMLTEKNNAKQEVIIKLSDQVSACMSDPRRPVSSCGGSLDSQAIRRLQQQMENLKDDIEAYKTQNKFLNSEIYQLTKLWRRSSEQEKNLMVKCAYLEASICQVESRYLGVLRQLQETKSLDPVQRGAVQKMIEDALKGELKSVVKLNVARDHDEYGFKVIPDYEVEDMKLLAKIQALEIRSHNLLHQEGAERPLLSRWAQYLAGRSDDDLCPSPELKALLRAGVPHEYRQRVWSWMVRTRTRTIRDHHPRRYQQLCEKSRTSPHPASRQIQLDLHRTLTTNQHFSSPSSPALQQLRRILLAFSWQNPAIGYCQGLNRLAAIALLVLQSEEDAFWCLVSVVEAIMPQDYYTKNLVASQADQRVLKDFLAEKLPRLAAHFEDHSIDVSLITFNWFLVVFVESLPSDILLPLWDAFLYEGTKVIFRYALALFKYKEDDILKIHDGVEIYQYLRFFTKTISDSRRLTSIAFSDMNPFPGRLLRNRRALHLERLQGELRDLEEQQREFVTESAERKDKDLDTMVSEDDEEL
ncbi:TBC1 domain family member 2A [Chelmon rostratus]|uniref:TBC1 domain family member 2A n=1 Tax=Chelmon rostratus TaxID=109905 RepID=UPI001BEAF2F0|nr:TBC1 domain family member 2A [Chelmon rostratus]